MKITNRISFIDLVKARESQHVSEGSTSEDLVKEFNAWYNSTEIENLDTYFIGLDILILACSRYLEHTPEPRYYGGNSSSRKGVKRELNWSAREDKQDYLHNQYTKHFEQKTRPSRFKTQKKIQNDLTCDSNFWKYPFAMLWLYVGLGVKFGLTPDLLGEWVN